MEQNYMPTFEDIWVHSRYLDICKELGIKEKYAKRLFRKASIENDTPCIYDIFAMVFARKVGYGFINTKMCELCISSLESCLFVFKAIKYKD